MVRTINEEQILNISDSFTATGQSDENQAADGIFNLSISGTFVATIDLERSFDEKTTWVAVSSFSAVTEQTGEASVKNQVNSPVAYRLNCTAYTSGTVNFALTQ